MNESTADIPGTVDVPPQYRLNVDALTAYMTRHVAGFMPPLRVRQFTGGFSNPTYLLQTPSRGYVLRKKPIGNLLPSAHAIDREYEILAALATTDFPVPHPYCLCRDEAVLGQMFYVMEYMPGRVIRDPAIPGATPEARRATYRAMAEVMAKLHTLDYAAAGLGKFARSGNYYLRQVTRWGEQFQASKTKDIPTMDALSGWLTAHVPDDNSTSIAHGDLRLENLVFHPREPRVVALLDWELCTIGHPLADVGLNCLCYYVPQGITFGFRHPQDHHLPGLPTLQEHLADYFHFAGREPVPDFTFYAVFAMYRQACAIQGIAKRAMTGAGSSAHIGDIEQDTQAMAEAAWELTRRGL